MISPTDTLIISKPCPECHGVGYIVTNHDGIREELCRVCHGDKTIGIGVSIVELAEALRRLISPAICLDDIDYGEMERAEIEALVEEERQAIAYSDVMPDRMPI